MNRYALSFTVRPGSEPAVAEILRSYRRPAAGAAAGGQPLLRRTSVFIGGQRVVRVMDVAGELDQVMTHLATQPQIRAVEEALDPYLAQERDLRTPEGVRAFVDAALLPVAVSFTTPAELLPQVPEAQQGQRLALLYPVRPGCGPRTAQLLATGAPPPLRAGDGSALAGTTVFQRDDVLVRVFEVDGSVPAALDHLARVAAASEIAPELGDLLDTKEDLTTEDGFRTFLSEHRLELVTDRRVGAPV